MIGRKRRLAKRRRQTLRAHIGRNRLWNHYLKRGWSCFIDQLSSDAPQGWARSHWGYQVRLW